MDYYILAGSEQRGPFTWEQLCREPISAETLVWHDGLGEWKRADHVSALRPLLDPYASPSVAEPVDPTLPAPGRRRHGRFGVASFILALTSGLAIFCLIALAGYLAASNPDGIDDQPAMVMGIGFGILAAAGGNLIGMGLGLAGLFERDRFKAFAIIGLLFNLLSFLIVGGLILVGISAK